MKKIVLAILIAPLSFACNSQKLADRGIDPVIIARTIGKPGEFDPGASTLKFAYTRNHIEIRIQNQKIPGELALQSWMTFSGTRDKTTLLGDIPLLSTEVDSFLKTAVETGIVVTALHDRLRDESPRILSAHFEMFGNELHVAQAASTLWKMLLENRFSAQASVQKIPKIDRSRMDQEKMESRLWKGALENGVFRVALGRATLLHGKSVGQAAGVSSWATFAGHENQAIVNADIATLESELPLLLRTVLRSGLQVLSIHTHLTHEKPRLLFVHVFGVGTAESLAKSIREAIELKEEFQSQ